MTETKRRVVVRRGRQWAPLQGGSAEANELARLLRECIQAADLTLNELYAKLTPEHFGDARVPSRATIGRRLSGDRLENDWEVVEAIIDVTSRDLTEYKTHRARARDLWDKARHSPTEPEDVEESADEEPEEVSTAGPGGVIFNGGVRDVHVSISDGGTSAALLQQIIDLQAELLEARRQLLEANERLRQLQLRPDEREVSEPMTLAIDVV